MPITKDQIIAEFQRFCLKEGRSPNNPDYEPKGNKPFSAATAKRLFGSWNNALVASGLKINCKTENNIPANLSLISSILPSK